MNTQELFTSDLVLSLRADLALALRAAAHHNLAEGICNHMSLEVPDSPYFLLNPRGFLWSEIQATDIIMVDLQGNKVEGKHEVETTAMFIHAAVHRIANKKCVLHTHMPFSTALTLTTRRSLDTRLSQNSMRFHGRVGIDVHYNGFALDATEGERIANSMANPSGGFHDICFLGNHGVIVCGDRMDHTYVDLYYLERSCQVQVLAQSSGDPLAPVSDEIATRVRDQTVEDCQQSELFFEALRRTLR
jgi:ribulose-5-phosphate 4-epimerase/fuculose-1-phosphate aldolase